MKNQANGTCLLGDCVFPIVLIVSDTKYVGDQRADCTLWILAYFRAKLYCSHAHARGTQARAPFSVTYSIQPKLQGMHLVEVSNAYFDVTAHGKEADELLAAFEADLAVVAQSLASSKGHEQIETVPDMKSIELGVMEVTKHVSKSRSEALAVNAEIA